MRRAASEPHGELRKILCDEQQQHELRHLPGYGLRTHDDRELADQGARRHIKLGGNSIQARRDVPVHLGDDNDGLQNLVVGVGGKPQGSKKVLPRG